MGALTTIALRGTSSPGPKRRRLLLNGAPRHDAAEITGARFAPENYRHKVRTLCAAEYAPRGRKRECGGGLRLRPAPSTGASQNEFPSTSRRLLFELAGRFLLTAATNRPVLAEFHLKAAYNAYHEWGAAAKHRDPRGFTFPQIHHHKKPKAFRRSPGGEGGIDLSTSMLNGGRARTSAPCSRAATIISREVVAFRPCFFRADEDCD